jgi:hypothetical protein
MDPLFRWIESTPLSVWTRESTSILAFPAILSAHAIGMALAVGVNVAIAIHLLGMAPGIPTRELRRFSPIMMFGFWLTAASGAALLIAYPTKALTNPLFYVKLGLIGIAMSLSAAIDRRFVRPPQPRPPDERSPRTARWLAVASLAAWAGAITAGRLLAYTYRRLLVDF